MLGRFVKLYAATAVGRPHEVNIVGEIRVDPLPDIKVKVTIKVQVKVKVKANIKIKVKVKVKVMVKVKVSCTWFAMLGRFLVLGLLCRGEFWTRQPAGPRPQLIS